MYTLVRRILVPFASSLVVSLALAGTALATTDHWFSGSLGKDLAYASVGAHSVTYVEGDAYNDLICIGAETGNAGSYYDAPFFSDCQAQSVSGVAHSYYSGSCCFHATVIYGGPAASKTILSATHYDY